MDMPLLLARNRIRLWIYTFVCISGVYFNRVNDIGVLVETQITFSILKPTNDMIWIKVLKVLTVIDISKQTVKWFNRIKLL